MTYAVTGASGQLGRLVADQLLGTVDPADVVLVTRDPARLADLAARGADVRAGDFTDPATLPGAFAGVDVLLLISTDAVGARVEAHTAAIEAARAAGVQRIVYTSVPRPDEANPAVAGIDHLATEQALRASGVRWTFLRNNLYADMQVATLQQAADSGRLVVNTGSGGAAYVTRADCAAAAVGALTGTGHDDRAYDVTGDHAWTADELAALTTEITGKPVEVVQVDDAAYDAGLQEAGVPAFVTPLLVTFGAAIREGWLDDVSTAVADLAGRAPTPLADVLRAGGLA